MKCKLYILAFFTICLSCGPSKVTRLREDHIAAQIRLPSEDKSFANSNTDTIPEIVVTDIDGNKMKIVKTIVDEKTGETMVSQDMPAIYVVAKFRNVAERNGKINLEFEVIVPEEIIDQNWQVRMHPTMTIMEDSIRLNDVIITGEAYRKEQLKGYQRYERFLNRIVNDSSYFVDRRNLEIFISRNIPEIYAFKEDTSIVSSSEFASHFGVDSKAALDHYTRHYLIQYNQKLISQKDSKRNEFVKMPIQSERVQLDSVVTNNAEITYHYVQTIDTRPGLRKVQISLNGEVYENDEKIYDLPATEELTFYISSVSSLVDESPKYLKKVISRNLQTSTSCVLGFEQGKSKLNEDYLNNKTEIARIKNTIKELYDEDQFDIDSILIVASSSPEGRERNNLILSQKRADIVSKYFSAYTESLNDSSCKELSINLSDYEKEQRKIQFLSRTGGENWTTLDSLVIHDTVLTNTQKEKYFKIRQNKDKEKTEEELKHSMPYSYFNKKLYPLLRIVSFDFYLHRKEMIKDTIHTTILDTTYMTGVKELRDHNYESALKILSPYKDYNAALACISLGKNLTAKSILENYPNDAKINYLLAIIYSRQNDDQKAVDYYLKSCYEDQSFIHRGNLDPEISSLINKYNLNQYYYDTKYENL